MSRRRSLVGLLVLVLAEHIWMTHALHGDRRSREDIRHLADVAIRASP